MHAWVIANWKQHPATKAQAVSLTNKLTDKLAQTWQSVEQHSVKQHCQFMIIPTHLHLDAVITTAANALNKNITWPWPHLQFGVQDISSHAISTGAFTGDCSAGQAQDLGATWTLVGHSERRQYHQEGNVQLFNKIRCALKVGLGVVLCVGESLSDHQNALTQETLTKQLAVFDHLTTDELTQLSSRLLLAYEPVWAIGTGKVPDLQEVNETHQFIKTHIKEHYPSLANVPILYGGSVNESNAGEFASSKLVDGVLVGGASLVADKFVQIAQAFLT